MNKKNILLIIIAVILGGIGYWIYQVPKNKIDDIASSQNLADTKNSTYIIGDQPITLVNGLSEIQVAPESASKTVTKYFGNEKSGDFNADGKIDFAFILTQNSGGTGTLYYVAALLSGPDGYHGTNAVFLGDRISPQTTEYLNGEIIVNYADRKTDEPMSAVPSVGISKYFRVTGNQLQEIDKNMSEAEARTIAEASCIKGGEATEPGVYNENSKTWWFNANLNATKPGCNPACVVNAKTRTAEINWRCTGAIPPEINAPTLETTCSVASRKADVCTQNYDPVCASVQIQCIKAPCNPVKQTFSNACEACRNKLVSGYVMGECVPASTK